MNSRQVKRIKIQGIGRRLTKARLAAGYKSPMAAADALPKAEKVTFKMIYLYEQHQAIPGGLALKRLCRLYGADANDILGL